MDEPKINRSYQSYRVFYVVNNSKCIKLVLSIDLISGI